MVKRCEVCGATRINLRHSASSFLFGDICFCSSFCSNIFFRYIYLIISAVCAILVIIFSYGEPAYAFFSFMGSIFFLGWALKGFSNKRKLDTPSIVNPKGSIANRMKKYRESLKNIQNKSDSDPQGLFDLSTGKLKSKE